MSCQSLAPARAFPPPPPDTPCTSRHRSVRFSSESQSSFRRSSNDTECKRETPGSISLTTLVTTVSSTHGSTMSQSAPSGAATFGDLCEVTAPALPGSCRFPKLEECAHFHYERVSLGGLRVGLMRDETDAQTDDELSEGWVCLRVSSHVSAARADAVVGWSGEAAEWTLSRNADNFRMLDNMLHRCIYDRKVSGLCDLSLALTPRVVADRASYESLVSDYLHHLSIIADDTINCAPILNWLQVDNRGHRLLVANEDSSSINTPAVAAAYSVRKYVSQARDEISFEVGDMISIIDMPGPQESLWWRGKRGFKVGFFPHHCVAVIGDKVPRHMPQPPPIVGSVAVASIKPVLRKHGKLISLFRSFILSRPSRRTLKQQGILRERVFGCDLGEHLLNSSHDVPLVLLECARVIESHGAVDGVYRLSGGSGLTQRLRAAFDEGRAPDLAAAHVLHDVHAVASLLKMYFRELPNPLCTYQLYSSFVSAVQPGPEQTRLRLMRETVVKLPPPHYRTLSYLMRHLRRVSLLGAATGMTARNMAIVWAPNLLRSPHSQHALQGVAVQAVVTEFLICYAEELFAEEQGEAPSEPPPEPRADPRRPKSLPLHAPAKLLSLEEARQRGGACASVTSLLPPPSGAIAAAASTQLRPASHKEPKYIEVGSGPNNLPQYHTVIERPNQAGAAKRALKRSPSGWRGLFSLRSKQLRPPLHRSASSERPSEAPPHQREEKVEAADSPLRPVKSCESLHSEAEQLAPLAGITSQIGRQHARSASCDSYFEPWQTELADMRLRLSPQERDNHMFSEEDDTALNPGAQLSLASSPGPSEMCSVEPSPRKPAQLAGRPDDEWEHKRTKLEEQLSNIGYIDGADSPRGRPSPEKRHSDEWEPRVAQAELAKRLCKDRESPHSSADVFHSPAATTVKMRERSSPRKNRGSARYSGLHQPVANLPCDNDHKIIKIVNELGQNNRQTWHGAKDNHSTLIKIDWPVDSNSLTPSTLMSSPLTPVTPVYDALDSDSDISDNKQTVKADCGSCDRGKKCLKCELTDASGYDGQDSINVNQTVKEGNNFDRNEIVNHDVMTDSIQEESSYGIMIDSNAALKISTDGMEKSQSEKLIQDSVESSPVTSTNISYQNLNRLSNISTNSSNSDHLTSKDNNPYEIVSVDRNNSKSVMTSSHESSSSYSNVSPKPADELYECFSFNRPNYINLQSSGSSKSTSPLKSPLRSTISITFKSPTKVINDYETVEIGARDSERDSVYEDVDLDKNLSIVEDATLPECDASLPTQEAAQPNSFTQDLIILESPINHNNEKDMALDVYSQVKFFKKSIEEVNAMILESPSQVKHEAHYENVDFSGDKELNYENVALKTDTVIELMEPQLCIDSRVLSEPEVESADNVNVDINKIELLDMHYVEPDSCERIKPKLSLPIGLDDGNATKNKPNRNVRELAHKFESPTDQKCAFVFDKPYREVKYPTLDRKKDIQLDRTKSFSDRQKSDLSFKLPPPVSPKTYKLTRNSSNARSLDENAFVTEFGRNIGKTDSGNFQSDPHENEECHSITVITPTTENKITLVQPSFTLPKSPTKSLNFEMDKKLSRERIEKYKEERRNMLREKYSSHSFRSQTQSDGKSKKRQNENENPSEEVNERLTEELPKFERRNTVDLGQRMRFTLNRPINIDGPSRSDDNGDDVRERRVEPGRPIERKEKMSPSYNIRDMAAMFEQKSQNNTG